MGDNDNESLSNSGTTCDMTRECSQIGRQASWRPLKSSLAIAVGIAVGATVVAPATASENTLEEVVVTASGRLQNVQDIPYNISSLDGELIDRLGITDVYELSKMVPGLAYADVGVRGAIAPQSIIRGLSTNGAGGTTFPSSIQPSVSTYINSTPLFVNLRLKDLERVEVLRGPQGTLYGVNAEGGTIRFLYRKPDMDETAYRVQAGVGNTDGSSGVNYNTDVMANVPLTDTLAMRVSVGVEEHDGFIDAPNRYVLDAEGVPVPVDASDPVNSPALRKRENDVNSDKTESLHAAFRWMPNDVFDAELTYHYQTQTAEGKQEYSYAAYDSDAKTYSQIPETLDSKVNMGALELQGNLGFATVTSSTSYYKTEAEGIDDITGFYLSFPFYTDVYGDSPRPLAKARSKNDSRSFVEEIRLVSDTDGPFDWIVGAFYQKARYDTGSFQFVPGYSDYYDACMAEDPATRPCGGGTQYPQIPNFGSLQNQKDFSYVSDNRKDTENMAIFGEIGWQATEKLHLLAGVRAYDYQVDSKTTAGLLFIGANGVATTERDSSDSEILAKYALSYNLDDSMTAYAAYSEGSRPGGINALPEAITFFGSEIPTDQSLFSYKSDQVKNREVGLKGTLLDRLNYTVTYFNMSWNDIQLGTTVTPLVIGAIINAGDASSEGFELDVSGPITDQLWVSIGYSYVDAKLTNASPPSGVPAGTYPDDAKLPGAPDHNATLALQYEQPLKSGLGLTYGLSAFYRGEAETALATYNNQTDDDFLTLDASLALNSDQWQIKAAVSNLANEKGIFGYPNPESWGDWASSSVVRPRTVSVNLTYEF